MIRAWVGCRSMHMCNLVNLLPAAAPAAGRIRGACWALPRLFTFFNASSSPLQSAFMYTRHSRGNRLSSSCVLTKHAHERRGLGSSAAAVARNARPALAAAWLGARWRCHERHVHGATKLHGRDGAQRFAIAGTEPPTAARSWAAGRSPRTIGHVLACAAFPGRWWPPATVPRRTSSLPRGRPRRSRAATWSPCKCRRRLTHTSACCLAMVLLHQVPWKTGCSWRKSSGVRR